MNTNEHCSFKHWSTATSKICKPNKIIIIIYKCPNLYFSLPFCTLFIRWCFFVDQKKGSKRFSVIIEVGFKTRNLMIVYNNILVAFFFLIFGNTCRILKPFITLQCSILWIYYAHYYCDRIFFYQDNLFLEMKSL